jgi:rRNA pseudouridine-1189 N-methylase Emg1 (Nep1/Mra1 family)
VRVKEVVLRGILCVNFAELHSMGKMNCTHICLLNITPVIYAKGKEEICYIEAQPSTLIAIKTSSVHDFSLC